MRDNMKKQFSIGYIDNYGDFTKVWDNKGYTLKFTTIEETEKYIATMNKEFIDTTKPIKIMQGWKVIKEYQI
jgi:hypothetical protein